MTLKEIGQTLHTARRAQGAYLHDVKTRTGMHPTNVSEIERGKKLKVQFVTLQRLCALYGYELVMQKKAGAEE